MYIEKNRNEANGLNAFSIVETMIALVLMTLSSLAFFQVSDQLANTSQFISIEEEYLKNEILADYKLRGVRDRQEYIKNDLVIIAELEQHPEFPQFEILTLISSEKFGGVQEQEKYLLHK